MVLLLGTAQPVHSQDKRGYAGGSVGQITSEQSKSYPLGGTTTSGGPTFGIWLRSHPVAFEVEATFTESTSAQYQYNPGPTRRVTVLTSRRDTFLAFQVRTRAAFIEPVVGVVSVLGHSGRDARESNGSPYFRDARNDLTFGVSGGLDIPVHIGSHLSVYPTLRAIIAARGGILGQTDASAVSLRYGAGARVEF